MNWPLLRVALEREEDIVAARQRARLLAVSLGFEVQDQTRIATAVSEIARNAVSYGHGGTVEFAIGGKPPAQLLWMRIADHGSGIADLDAVLEGRWPSPTGMGLGIVGTRRLMDRFDIRSGSHGTTVEFAKILPHDRVIVREAIAGIAAGLAQAGALDPLAELRTQNHELFASLDELRARQEDLRQLNAELEDTNRGVVALYAELDERAEELRRTSELKSRFLSNISHEFRTPLNSILAIATLLLDRTDGELSAEQERQVGYIHSSARHLTELVNDLLDLAKVEAGKTDLRLNDFEVPALFGALRGMMKPLQSSTTVALVFDDCLSGPPLHSDEGKVAQILRNLVSNAFKFTEHGEVRVSTRYDAVERRYIFTVADSGIGIAREDQERIFEEFIQIPHRLQERVKGTGLGLPLSRRLAELLGGTLTVESAPGCGSTFVLTIPARLGDPDTAPEPLASAVRVLLIDDDEPFRYVLNHLLAGSRYALVAEAHDGPAGLRQARALRPDLIVLDLHMPGLDGYGVLDALADDTDMHGIPVLVCTSSMLTSADRLRLMRAVAILPKHGLSRESVLAAADAALTERQPA
jgi:signal transduction histidine kinase/CheY-like chemotaxis protein